MTTFQPFLARRIFGVHPGVALALHVITAVIAIFILIQVANARGRSPWWSLLGIFGVPGLVIGLLVLIALPVQPTRA